MSIVNKPLSTWTAHDVRSLVAATVQETRTVEFKRDLPTGDDAGKREFCKDVSAMANAIGGVIVFGVAETQSSDRQGATTFLLAGVDLAVLDKAQLRMESLVRDGIEPFLFGVEFKQIGVDAVTVLVVSVPRSLSAPHMVTVCGLRRFHVRTSNGTAEMDVEELRSAFLGGQVWQEQFERFRRERILKLLGDRGPVPGIGTNLIVLHLVPLGPKQAVDVGKQGLESALMPPGRVRGWSARYNLDGRLGFFNQYSYAQLFRDGSLEAATPWGINDDNKGNPIIAAEAVTPLVGQDGFALLKAAQSLDLRPPFAFALSILGARGRRLHPGGNTWWSDLDAKSAYGDEVLALPEVVFHAAVDNPEFQVQVRPILDILWQAFGFARCSHYGANGQIDGRWLAR